MQQALDMLSDNDHGNNHVVYGNLEQDFHAACNIDNLGAVGISFFVGSVPSLGEDWIFKAKVSMRWTLHDS